MFVKNFLTRFQAIRKVHLIAPEHLSENERGVLGFCLKTFEYHIVLDSSCMERAMKNSLLLFTAGREA